MSIYFTIYGKEFEKADFLSSGGISLSTSGCVRVCPSGGNITESSYGTSNEHVVSEFGNIWSNSIAFLYISFKFILWMYTEIKLPVMWWWVLPILPLFLLACCIIVCLAKISYLLRRLSNVVCSTDLTCLFCLLLCVLLLAVVRSAGQVIGWHSWRHVAPPWRHMAPLLLYLCIYLYSCGATVVPPYHSACRPYNSQQKCTQ